MREVHDLHASSVASDLPVLTAHVVVDNSCFHDGHLPRLLDEREKWTRLFKETFTGRTR